MRIVAPALCLTTLAGCAGTYLPWRAEVPDETPRATVVVEADADSTLHAYFDPEDFEAPVEVIEAWIDRSVHAVTRYLGAFPVPRTHLVLVPTGSSGVGFGIAHGGRVPTVKIYLGAWADEGALGRDWVLPHELIHVAYPATPRSQRWAGEGLATYVEPLARARAGLIAPEDAWRRLARGLPEGQPRPGDAGLDRTPTWGRTYWGGALFFLLADVSIREATENREGLETALSAVNAAGGDGRLRWSCIESFRAADRGLSVPVLERLYARHRHTPVRVDLDRLLAALGVVDDGDSITLVDDAPLAPLRRAMTGEPTGIGAVSGTW